MSKLFSIIIPDTDSRLIASILESLERQSVPLADGEVLVVGSDAPGLVVQNEHIRFIPTGESDRFASDKRNLGMQFARGEIVLFLDDDCLPEPGWLEAHLHRHRAGEQVVGGAVRLPAAGYLQLADNVSAFHDLLPHTPEGPRTYLAAANLSVQRDVIRQAGPMLAHKNRAEDLEWSARLRKLGYRLYFEPRAVILHDPPRHTWSSVWQHWWLDAPDTLQVRLKYSDLLSTPRLASYRASYLWGAPLVAAWATLRTFTNRLTLQRYGHTLPLVYLTKLAWCWSAYRHFPLVSYRSA